MPKTVLIPAAGAGRRFERQGITPPKPLIQIAEKSLLEHTLSSFRFETDDQLILAVQKQHRIREQLGEKLQRHYPNLLIHWVELDALLPGQLATARAAVEASTIEPNHALLIHNCDTGFRWSSALEKVDGFAAMAVFEAAGDHWSFGCPDPSDPGRAIAIAEKQRISPLASIGLYSFSSSEAFLTLAEQQLRDGSSLRGEHYIAPMLQRAIEQGLRVSLPRVDGVRLFGTPEELCREFMISLDQLKRLNPATPARSECQPEHPQDTSAGQH